MRAVIGAMTWHWSLGTQHLTPLERRASPWSFGAACALSTGYVVAAFPQRTRGVDRGTAARLWRNHGQHVEPFSVGSSKDAYIGTRCAR